MTLLLISAFINISYLNNDSRLNFTTYVMETVRNLVPEHPSVT